MNKNLFKEKLEIEKMKLEEELKNIGIPNPTIPGDYEAVPMDMDPEADLIDRSNAVIAHEENAAILSDLEMRYDAVCGALLRIEEGIYGVCKVCGNDIEEKRLTADPAAETCIKDLK